MPVFPNAKPSRKDLRQGQPYNTTADQKHIFIVPEGEVWEIERAFMDPVDSSTLQCYITDNEDALYEYIISVSATTGTAWGPPNLGSASYPNKPILLYEGDKVVFNFGTAQTTGGDKIKLRVLVYQRKDVLSN